MKEVMSNHRINITAMKRGKYRVTYAGETLIKSTLEPLFNACRALQTKGITGRLQM
jgi:hypothetical protein